MKTTNTVIMHQTVRLAALVASIAAAAMADQVTLKNGDRLTGTILKSDGKKLTLKTEYAGTVEIDWNVVAGMTSKDPLTVLLSDGQQVVGAVDSKDGKIELATKDAGSVATQKDSIKTIRNVDEQKAYEAGLDRLRNPRLIDLWSGFFDTGLSKAAGNSQTTTFALGMNAARVSTRDKIGTYFNSIYATNSTTGTKITSAKATRGGVSYNMNVSKKTYAFGFTDLEFDQFQKLDLRFVGGGGFGYHAVKSDTTMLDLFGGGSLNKEFYSTGLSRSSGEMLFGDEFNRKMFKSTSLHQKWVMFPNLSDSGQYRMNFDIGATTAVAKWFGWNLTFSDRYISNPVKGLKNNDTMFTTGVRLTFGR